MTWASSTHSIDCDLTGATHHVSIDRPMRYDRLEAPPLIVCVDGAWTTGTVRDATRIMSMSGAAPEAVVAGVWFDDDSMAAYLRSRARWFTPTPYVPPPEVGVKGITEADTGHAATYQRFVAERLLPWLAEQVRFGDIWLVGHSFSGLFGLRVLFTQPDLFDRYLLASPSIWWHDRSILEWEAGFAASPTGAGKAGGLAVFLSAGESEVGDGSANDPYRMRANVVEMAARLGALDRPGLGVTQVVLPDQTHNSTIGAAVSAGLRALHTNET